MIFDERIKIGDKRNHFNVEKTIMLHKIIFLTISQNPKNLTL